MATLKSVLVTGGAGYIGSVLVQNLVNQNYNVTVLDSLIYGNDGISKLVEKNSIQLIQSDIRNKKLLEEQVNNIDCIVHLAAIVGEPLCKKIPVAARQINEIGTRNLVEICKKKGVSRFIFASTCSNYGSSSNLANEFTPVKSLSLYSETKVNSESIILSSQDSNFESCILRFATAFGISPRMRFDLLLQDLIRDAVLDNKIVVFGPNFWRPLVHVQDIAKACIYSIEGSSKLISGEIYNVGDTNENYTKIQLAKMVQKHVPSAEIEIQELKQDPRNYRVSFDKIKNNLHFNITKTVSDGIKEIIEEIRNNKLDPKQSEFSNLSKQTEKVRVF